MPDTTIADPRLGGVDTSKPAKPGKVAKEKVTEDSVMARLKCKRSTTYKKTDSKGVVRTGSINGTLSRVTRKAIEAAIPELGGKASRPIPADDDMADKDTSKNSFAWKPGENPELSGKEFLFVMGVVSAEDMNKAIEKAQAAAE